MRFLFGDEQRNPGKSKFWFSACVCVSPDMAPPRESTLIIDCDFLNVWSGIPGASLINIKRFIIIWRVNVLNDM